MHGDNADFVSETVASYLLIPTIGGVLGPYLCLASGNHMIASNTYTRGHQGTGAQHYDSMDYLQGRSSVNVAVHIMLPSRLV